jgi:hypothetical protein
MFWKFFLGLLIISVIFPFLWILLATPVNAVMMLFFKTYENEEGEKQPKALSLMYYPIIAIVFLAHVYIVCGWSAFVVSRAVAYTWSPGVTHKWIYYVVGFILCYGPLGFMASKEGREGSFSSCLHISIAMLVYIIFAIWPKLMTWPYGWFLRWIYG